MATSVKVSVAFLKKKVEEAKAKYLKDWDEAEAKYQKELVKYEAAVKVHLTAVKKAVDATFKKPVFGQNITWSYNNELHIIVEGVERDGGPSRPSKPRDKNTKPFDVKLAMLEGAVGTDISIRVDDGEWASFLA